MTRKRGNRRRQKVYEKEHHEIYRGCRKETRMKTYPQGLVDYATKSGGGSEATQM